MTNSSRGHGPPAAVAARLPSDAVIRLAGAGIGRPAQGRRRLLVELPDGTRKLLSELTGAEAAAGLRFFPDPKALRIESGRWRG
jgi:hypothetical protein